MRTTKSLLMTLCFTAMIGGPAFAGTDPVPMGGGDKHQCMMASAETWKSFGVTDEQMARVNEVQAACKSDYETAKANGTDADAAVSKHKATLKEVLTEAQFSAWKTWCAEQKGS